jgi:hypothetical protein
VCDNTINLTSIKEYEKTGKDEDISILGGPRINKLYTDASI